MTQSLCLAYQYKMTDRNLLHNNNGCFIVCESCKIVSICYSVMHISSHDDYAAILLTNSTNKLCSIAPDWRCDLSQYDLQQNAKKINTDHFMTGRVHQTVHSFSQTILWDITANY